MPSDGFDVAVIGGGIVGLSTAFKLLERFPHKRICVLEKENGVGLHQSGRNSGVLHSGIYYQPGSLRATLCRAGITQMVSFCQQYGIRHDICGKLIVATDKDEMPMLERLYQRGCENGLSIEKLDKHQLNDREPHVKGEAALFLESTGIADFGGVCEALKALIEERGGKVFLNSEVRSVSNHQGHQELNTTQGRIKAHFSVNCAGLHSDRVARLWNESPVAKIVPFRGEFYQVNSEKSDLIRHLIYPLPNPKFPFLGVHVTRTVDGGLHVGPNAVLSLKREGYGKFDFDLRDAIESLSYIGFWRLAFGNMREGINELHRSLSKRAFLNNVQRLVPSFQAEDLSPCDSGVRAMALLPDGTIVDDFMLLKRERVLHVLNAPSPAATSALAIADMIVSKIETSI
jgi:L-2-hydroxyglutarate oxidase